MLERVVLEPMAIDPLVDEPGWLPIVRDLVSAGGLDLLITHVHLDELFAIRDRLRKARLLRALIDVGSRLVPTDLFILGADADPARPPHRQPFRRSRVGFARLGDPDVNTRAEHLRTSEQHREDSLIVATAYARGAILITGERRRRRAIGEAFPGLMVWSLRQFEKQARELHATLRSIRTDRSRAHP